MSTTIAIGNQNKARFDNLRRVLSVQQKRDLSQDETIDFLLSEAEAKVYKELEA